MNRLSCDILDYYDEEIIKLISDKYGFSKMDSLRLFMKSEAYQMLIDAQNAMWEFAPLAIFDMWEVEQINGNPRNSLYLRRDEYV